VLGAGLGTLAYWLLALFDIHSVAVVGAASALGVSAAARTTSNTWGLLTACLAVVFSLLVEFLVLPFRVDPSLGYFITHLDDLPRNSLVSLAVVAVVGFWFGRGRVRRNAVAA